MWGKVFSHVCHLRLDRITPTHVGKSRGSEARRPPHRDHPHPCGEKAKALTYCKELLGSPPPMWGKESLSAAEYNTLGITPTHVGKRNRIDRVVVRWEDHPHPCGEKYSYRRRTHLPTGITPTHVGKRPSSTSPA